MHVKATVRSISILLMRLFCVIFSVYTITVDYKANNRYVFEMLTFHFYLNSLGKELL